VVGTHTHVPTADAQVLPKGTAYVTDVGMVGPAHSIIGVEVAPMVDRYLSALPRRTGTAKDTTIAFNAVLADIDPATGRARSIERVDRNVVISS